ncbi:MAG: HAMP domain-containing protein [Polyangiaceae bacterium]|nr:HAMP domain-containing protein [Polyangiaceae bacterium]
MTAPEDPSAATAPGSGRAGGRARDTLARRVLVRMAVRLAAVAVLLTAFGYWHVVRSITNQSVDNLAGYVKARRERELSLLLLAADNHQALFEALLGRLRAYGAEDPVEEFDRRYERLPDGSTRRRSEGFDGRIHAGVFVGRGAEVTADLRRRILSAHDVIEPFGRAMGVRFLDTWIVMPENVVVLYWPSAPRWTLESDAGADMTKEEFFAVGAPKRDPERKTVWTKHYVDPTAKTCMVSVATPLYDGDRFLGVIGHDIPLTDLIHRTMSDRLEGTYNVLFRKDGYLVAHPELAGAIEAAGGSYDIKSAGDPALEGIYRRALTVSDESAVVESEDGASFLGVARLPGPDWYLVSVYPKALIERTAYGSARFILLGGVVSIVLEIGIVFYILRDQVTRRLAGLGDASKRVAAGDLDVRVEARGDDEIGQLAATFNVMAAAVRDREERRRKADEEIHALNEGLRQNLEVVRERNLTLEQLRLSVEALSTPVLEVWSGVLALPVIGAVDAQRAATMTEKLLGEVVRTQCRFVILDVTGVDLIDTATADRLLRVALAVELLGARCVVTGVRPSVAQSLVALDVGLGRLKTARTLEHALRECIQSKA